MVNHPVRRRIVLALILLGNAGVISVIGTLVLSFSNDNGESLLRLSVLVGGLVLLLLLARSKWLDRRLSRLIGVALRRWTDLDVRDYSSLLELNGDYDILELQVEGRDWLAERSLDELRLRDEGIVVLGIHRGSRYVGAPRGDTRIRTGDTLIVYGRAAAVCELDARPAGKTGAAAHQRAVAEQDRIEEEQQRHEAQPGDLPPSRQARELGAT